MSTSVGSGLGAGLLKSVAEAALRLLKAEGQERSAGGVSSHRSVAERLAEAAVPLCSLRVVDLAQVKARLGERWPAMSEKVHVAAQTVIQRHLMRGDVYDRHGEDGYLVLFASLGKAEAEFKGSVIAREIAERLLGEEGASELDITSACAAIPARSLLEGDPNAVIAEALERAEAGGDAEPAVEAAPAEEPLVHSYSPVWDTKQMTLLHFRAHIPRAYGEMEERASEGPAHNADVTLLRGVARDLQGLAAEGRRFPVAIQIEHSSLASNSRRTNIVQALSGIPIALRKFATLEIGAPLDGFWTYGCKTFLEMSRPLGIGLSARVRLEEPQAIPVGSGLRSIAVDLGGQYRGEAATLRLLTAFCEQAGGLGHECAAYGLNSRALVLGAMGAGFRYVSGRAVHADVPEMSNALRFEPLDLYADVQRASAPRPS